LHSFIVQKYVEKRKAEVETKKEGHSYITPRTLLAIIRLSQGLARLRFNDEVQQMDVDEALRLIEVSRSQINDEDSQEKVTYNMRNDTSSTVFHILRELCKGQEDKTIKIADLLNRIKRKNLTEEDMYQSLQEYSNLQVILIDKNNTEVTLI